MEVYIILSWGEGEGGGVSGSVYSTIFPRNLNMLGFEATKQKKNKNKNKSKNKKKKFY